MSTTPIRHTWDGQPISPEPPYGATVVVFQRTPELALLMLHRAHNGPDFEGDWAWTPPAGSRKPGEPILAAAERELWEEAGLRLPLQPTAAGTSDWYVYLAESNPNQRVQLHDPEHDRYEWMDARAALDRTNPALVREALERAVEEIKRL